MIRRGLGLLILGFVFTGQYVSAASDPVPRMSFYLPSFEVSFINATQGSGNTASGMIAWTPRYVIDATLALRANLGASALLGKNSHGDDMTFAMFDAELLLRMYFLEHFDFEIGGGAQDWDNQGGIQGAASANFGFHFAPGTLVFIDRVFVGYTAVFQDPTVNEVRAGLGMAF